LAALESASVRTQVLAHLVRGISQSEGVVPGDEGMLSVQVGSSEQQHLTVVKQFALDRFDLVVDKAIPPLIETMPSALRLRLRETALGVSIELDLYELLRRMSDGLRADSAEFAPLLADLAVFKSALLLHESRHLVLIESGTRRHAMQIRDGKLIRSVER